MEGKTRENLDDEEEKGFVALANEFLEKCSIKTKVYKLTDCKDEFFVAVYKGLIGDDLKGLIANPVTINEHINNCQCVIDTLSNDVLNVDLSHISAGGIIHGDTVCIRNLLEIFTGLLEYFLECMDENQSDSEGELDDSNVLSSQHEVISGLLREEFGPYQDTYRTTQKSTGQQAVAGNGFEAQRMALSSSSVFDRTNYSNSMNTRDTREDSSRITSLIGSGHEADTSEVSDSTNELIKLGETSTGSRSINSLLDKRNEAYKIPSRSKHVVRSDTWSHSTSITDAGESDDLTQYTLTSEEGQRGSFLAPLKPSDNLSSSLVSSSSSWNQQISPLESETDGGKLASLGVRPKVDSKAADVNKDSSEEGGSGRSTPVLHHHYHHHFHHPVGSDTRKQSDKTATSTATRTDNDQHYPGVPDNTKVSGIDATRSVPGLSGITSQSLLRDRAGVPGLSNSIDVSRMPLPDFSSARAGLPSQSLKTRDIPKIPDHSFLRAGIPSHGTSSDVHIPGSPALRTRIPGQDAPSPGYSSLRAGTHTDSTAVTNSKSSTDYYSKRYGKMTSLSSTAPPLLRTATDPLSTGSAGHLASSGVLSDSVFTASDTAGLRKPYISHDKSLGAHQRQTNGEQTDYKPHEDRRKENVVTNDKPTSSRDTQETTQLTKEPSGLHKETKLRGDKDPKESDDIDDYDSDDSDIARHSDSAIDYNRGEVANESDSESTEDSILRRIHERWKRIETRTTPQSKSARRAVTFNEDIETIPITGRMDRLRRLLEDEAEEQRQQHTTAMRDAYAEQLLDIQRQQEQERSELKKRKRSPFVQKKKAKKPAPVKQRGRLETIYRPQGRLPRPKKRPPVKSRKRSASASPDIGRRRKVTDFQEALLPSLFEEFPFLHVSPQTTHAMWQKQARQLSVLSKSESEAKKSKGQRSVEEAEKRQERLLKILKKDLETNQRMRDGHERDERERAVKIKTSERRQIAARARRYYDEYQLRMRSKMLKRRTREEQIFKNLFDEGLEIQKQRVRELRKYAKEKREALEQRQTNEIESLENYYKDQFSMLAEGMGRERSELKIRQQAQEKVMRQMRRELRQKMEKEIRDVQESLNKDEDSAYFRQLEADRLRREFQLAMYKSDL